ncbi:MAG: hypothetical protein Hyperionvirus4_91 [Hyperionvirus sp.]|uniref:Uncharacterized protein n=1 Tax=Hyperionvirus sp. TaxID=2487770 RepID=A0A3G5A7A0_9VIRU|nr:MAG: hypothetical protein Hyperionvirus4_91 [Hyperionvirus sp.]
MAFDRADITLFVTGLLTAKEVLCYSRINRLCCSVINDGHSSNQIWGMLKNRDLSAVVDLVSAAVFLPLTVTAKKRYFEYSIILNGRAIRGYRTDVIKFSRKSVTKDYRGCLLKNGTPVDDLGLAVLNGLIALGWDTHFYKRGFTFHEVSIAAQDMLWVSAPNHPRSCLDNIDSCVGQWLLSWIREGVIGRGKYYYSAYNIIPPTSDQIYNCFFHLIDEVDGAYAQQISRIYTTISGKRVALFRARAPAGIL